MTQPGEMTQPVQVSSTPPVLVLPGTSDQLSARLQDGLDQVDALLRREVDHDDEFIAEANSHLIEAGGKRFRPLLTLLASELGSGSNPDVLAAVMSAVTLPIVANTSGIVSTASKSASGPIGRPIACATGRLVAMKVTWPGRPTEPRLITTASSAPAISCAVDRSTP